MLLTQIIFLPAAACLFWMLFHLLTASRTPTFWLFFVFLATTGIYLYTEACYALPQLSARALITNSLIAQLTGSSVLPLAWLYLERLKNREKNGWARMLWVILPVFLFASTGMVLAMTGREAIEDFLQLLYTQGYKAADAYAGTNVSFYYTSCIALFRCVLAAEMISFLTYVVILYRQRHFRLKDIGAFLFRGEKIPLLALQCFYAFLAALFFLSRILLLRSHFLAHPWIAPLTSVLITLLLTPLCLNALFSAEDYLSLRDIRLAFRYNYRRENKAEIQEKMIDNWLENSDEESANLLKTKLAGQIGPTVPKTGEAADRVSVAKDIFAAMSASQDEDSMLSRFENLMLKEQVFLQPQFSLKDVAERQGVSKKYLEIIPELINTLRIDFAEQYILRHRNAKQSEIAAASGFLSVSSFNNTFKKVTGITPKVWIASKDMHL